MRNYPGPITDGRIEDVAAGEVRVGTAGTTLVASGLGSCIAVVVLDRARCTGGIAHVMLPGQAVPDKAAVRHRYAVDAITELLEQLASLGSYPNDLAVCLAGGGNVLKREQDLICSRNIASVTQEVREKGLVVVARSLGGTRRRRIKLEVALGRVLCSEGDHHETVLWFRDTVVPGPRTAAALPGKHQDGD